MWMYIGMREPLVCLGLTSVCMSLMQILPFARCGSELGDSASAGSLEGGTPGVSAFVRGVLAPGSSRLLLLCSPSHAAGT